MLLENNYKSFYGKADKNRNPILVIENLNKVHNKHKTLNNVNLVIYEGEFFTLLGPSGCGKSTLLRSIAGFERPDSGKIMIDNVDISDLAPYERPINMMFQSYALFPHMSVRENIMFGLRQEKISKAEVKLRVEEVMSMLKLGNYSSRRPNELSGGQQQRVALARSLVKRPRILLLDEPLGALDLKIREHTQMELINLQHMLGITFIMVTHDQDEAMAMSNRMAIMAGGKLLQIGSPQDVYEYPNSRFVADFIGSINMFKGVITASDGEYMTIHSEEMGEDIFFHTNQKISIGTEVWMAVRPEEMSISMTRPASEDDNVAEGKILDVGFLGDQVVYHVILNTDKIIKVTVPTSARNRNEQLVVDSTVFVYWHDSDGVVLTK